MNILLILDISADWQPGVAKRLMDMDKQNQYFFKTVISPCRYRKRRLLTLQSKLEKRFIKTPLESSNSTISLPSMTNSIAYDIIIDMAGIGLEAINADAITWNVIWTLKYRDKILTEHSWPGLCEMQAKTDYIEIVIEQTDANSAKSIVVGKYNPHYSITKNFQNIVQSLHMLFLKAIFSEPKDIVTTSVIETSSGSIVNYLTQFYGHQIKNIITLIRNKISGFYPERWTIGISRADIFKDGLSNMKIEPERDNEFWADPFLFKKDGRQYLFFERFPFDTKKGVISCAPLLDDLSVGEAKDIIVKQYHLSFPFIFEEDGEIYLMPESSQAKDLEIYRCKQFPYEWELYAKGFEGMSLADTVYFRDDEGNRWLFATEAYSDISAASDHCTILNIYKIDSLQLKSVTPHKQNPICVDATFARNGGRIIRHDGRLYRTCQVNIGGRYGHGVTLREITQLSIDNYAEHEIATFDCTDTKVFNATHQMTQSDNIFVMDFCK